MSTSWNLVNFKSVDSSVYSTFDFISRRKYKVTTFNSDANILLLGKCTVATCERKNSHNVIRYNLPTNEAT